MSDTVEQVKEVDDGESKRMYRKAYYQANKEKYKNIYLENREQKLARQKEKYREKHPEKKTLYIKIKEEIIKDLANDILSMDTMTADILENLIIKKLTNK